MAKKASATGFASKHKNRRKDFDKVKGNETDFGSGGSLPPGIENGIAQLTELKLGIYENGDNKGEYFLYGHGTVLQPVEHQKQKLEGRLTKLGPWPLCDTPKSNKYPTFQDRINWALNELRKLGAPTGDIELEEFEAVVAQIKEEAPCFAFRTWQGKPTEQYPNPRVNEEWKGVVAYDGETTDDVQEDDDDDGSEAEEESGSDEEMSLDELAANADAGDEGAEAQLTAIAEENELDPEDYETWADLAAALQVEEDASDDDGEDVSDDSDDEDSSEYETSWQDHGALADDGDEESQAALEAQCEELDIDPNDYETWADVAEAIVAADGDGAEEDDGDDDASEAPAKDDIVNYKPKGKRKATEFEVTAVFPGKETCNLKSLDDNKVYKGVKWSDLA